MDDQQFLAGLGEAARARRAEDEAVATDVIAPPSADDIERGVARVLATLEDGAAADDAAFVAALGRASRSANGGERVESNEPTGASAPTPALTTADVDAAVAATLASLGIAAPEVAAPAPASEVVSFPSRRRRWVVLAPLAVAAALAVFVLRPVENTPDGVFPDYAIELIGAETAQRGESATEAMAQMRAGGHLELRLRPSTRVDGEIAVRGWLFGPGEPRRWNVVPQISVDGAIRVSGPVEALLPVPAGDWILSLGVGRPDALPSSAEAYRPQTPAPTAWHRHLQPIRLIAAD